MKLAEQPETLIMGHPILYQVQPQVNVQDIPSDDFQHNLSTLKQHQLASQGVGLAAPQVGWPARVLVLGISDANRSRYPQVLDIPFTFWINPQVIDCSKETCWTWEACLSVPGMRGWVERPRSVRVVGYNHLGERQEEELTGFHARVMLHEIDHLDGILFPTKVKDKTFLIPDSAIFHQDQWQEDWPSPGARRTGRGQLSPEG